MNDATPSKLSPRTFYIRCTDDEVQERLAHRLTPILRSNILIRIIPSFPDWYWADSWASYRVIEEIEEVSYYCGYRSVIE